MEQQVEQPITEPQPFTVEQEMAELSKSDKPIFLGAMSKTQLRKQTERNIESLRTLAHAAQVLTNRANQQSEMISTLNVLNAQVEAELFAERQKNIVLTSLTNEQSDKLIKISTNIWAWLATCPLWSTKK